MNMRSLCIALTLTAFAASLTAQMTKPRNVEAAYAKGSRSADGKPGPRYWTNTADYDIRIQCDPNTGTFTGSETVRYTNNSPDSLNQIVLRLYQDLLKANSPRDWQVDENWLHDGMKISKFVVNGKAIDLNQKLPPVPRRSYNAPPPPVQRNGTVLTVMLDNKVAPGAKLTLEVDWQFEIKDGVNARFGNYGKGNYFVAYWYPEIAVYDDVDGWDKIPFRGQAEMYHGFGNYNLAITVPDSIIVWSTGMLQNADEVLQPEYAGRYRRALTSDQPVRIITAEDLAKGQVIRANGSNTWRFRAENVPDVAFALSADHLWDACSAVADPATGRRVLTQASYNADAKFYDEAAYVAKLVIEDLSTNLPGVPYPWPASTVYQSKEGGGMEWPMIVNDGAVGSRAGLIELTHHEIAHSYFPFYMGINERKYAWMDEGWASVLPMDLSKKLEPKGNNYGIRYAWAYGSFAGTEMDVPLITPTTMLTGQAYSVHAYSKPATAYFILRDMLGDETFRKTMQLYVQRWNSKHPLPWDFFATFNEGSGQNLDWFWQPWFFENTRPDLSLADVQVKGGSVKFNVQNTGGLPVPVKLVFSFADGSSENLDAGADAWKSGNKTYAVKKKFDREVTGIALDTRISPDVNPADNSWKK